MPRLGDVLRKIGQSVGNGGKEITTYHLGSDDNQVIDMSMRGSQAALNYQAELELLKNRPVQYQQKIEELVRGGVITADVARSLGGKGTYLSAYGQHGGGLHRNYEDKLAEWSPRSQAKETKPAAPSSDDDWGRNYG